MVSEVEVYVDPVPQKQDPDPKVLPWLPLVGSIVKMDEEEMGELEKRMLSMPKEERMEDICKYVHSDGLVCKAAFYPAGNIILGHKHKHETMNILAQGKIIVQIDGEIRHLSAPYVVVSKKGCQKVAYVVEDCTWINVWNTDRTGVKEEKDTEKIEELLADYSKFFVEYKKEESQRLDYNKFVGEIGLTREQITKVVTNETDMVNLPDEFATKLAIGPSKIDGVGLFADSDFKIGDVIGPGRTNGFRTAIGRYTNHSHFPNSKFVEADRFGMDLVAIKPISKGEEIFVDYRQALSVNKEAKSLLNN